MGVFHDLIVPLSDVAGPQALITAVIAPILLLAVRYLYRISPWHPLYAVPGPLLARATSLWLIYHAWIGDESTAVHELHEKYGAVVCTGPDSVDIADGEALQRIYVERGGFLKPEFYQNFDIDGHHSLFSATDPSHRAPRAKPVSPVFSTANLRGGATTIAGAVDGFVRRLEREVEKAREGSNRVEVLQVCRGLALDAISSYLFGIKYGGCEEDINQQQSSDSKGSERGGMTASQMVDSFVAVGKSWYLPCWAFQLHERITGLIWSDEKVDASMNMVREYVARVVDQAAQDDKGDTYPARLLRAGFSEDEVRAQCIDVVFAGTDSTAMNLATICFMLAKTPSAYQALRREILETQPSDDQLQQLPYLRGVVREGLRMSMANPTRLPRVVPQGGYQFKEHFLPAGTVVSCTPYELHFNPDVYEEPHSFKPERWLAENKPTEEMNRDWIPFGLGSRQCIARNLATVELFKAVSEIAANDSLAGLQSVGDRIEIVEWFNSHVHSGKIELQLTS
ncbi:cytochrome P450 oxidoreductase [Xylariales sp. PMI_506]|nr:cytochrome P450 oxidoreductase [Xylariales sp. PMI_506]